VAAVSELRAEHGDEVDFVVVPPQETARRSAELGLFHLSSRKHGLVAFDASGEPVVTIAGHRFGRAELEMALAQVVEP
jgi:hypothetical protein